MKKNVKFSIVAILVLFLISSCIKNNDQLLINESKVTSALAMNAKEDRKIAFRLLNAAEKAEVWKKHLTECAKDKTFSNNQKDFILSLIPVLNGELFAKIPQKGESNSQLDNLQNQAKKLFKDYEISWLFFDISMEKPVFMTIPEEIKERLLAGIEERKRLINLGTRVPQTCQCSGADDWCGGFQGASGCIAIMQDCSGGGCTSSGGCGWWLWSSCDGTCVRYEVRIC